MAKKKLILAVMILLVMAIAGFLLLLRAYEDSPIEDTANYKISVYHDGSATISVSNINCVQQTDEEMPWGTGQYLMPGTLLIPGDGSKVYYDYPQHEPAKNLKGDQDE